MPQIGTFTEAADGFVGHIHTFSHCREFDILPAEPSDAENTPDFRIHLRHDDGIDAGPAIGAGWKRTGERAGTFIALMIDDPALPQLIRANLFRDAADGASWSLHWNRISRRDARD